MNGACLLGLILGLRGAGAVRRLSAGAAAHAALVHRLELLFLIVVQKRLDAVIGAFHDGAHLGAAIFLGQRLVLHERLHLLLAFKQQRLDLRLLVGGQAEFAGQALELTVGIHSHPASALRRTGLVLILWWGWVVLGHCGARHAEGEKSAECQGK